MKYGKLSIYHIKKYGMLSISIITDEYCWSHGTSLEKYYTYQVESCIPAMLMLLFIKTYLSQASETIFKLQHNLMSLSDI